MKRKPVLPDRVFQWLIIYLQSLDFAHFIARMVFLIQVLTLFFGAMLVQIPPDSRYYIGTPLGEYVVYTGILSILSFGFLYYFYYFRIYRGGYGLLGGLLYLSAYCACTLFCLTLSEFLFGYTLSKALAWIVATLPLLPMFIVFKKIQRLEKITLAQS